MQIRYLGHSAFEITDGKWNLLIDPFITGNPACPVKAEELHPQYILVTHLHDDHVGDTVAIHDRTCKVKPLNAGEPGWRYSDPHHKRLRIHLLEA